MNNDEDENLNNSYTNGTNRYSNSFNSNMMNKINNFDIKTTDGFPVAKASKILYKLWELTI